MSKTSALPRLVALQYRDFRLLWLGQLISITGSQMQIVAVDWHIYELLKGQTYLFSLVGWDIPLQAEALGLGALGLMRVLPIIVFALVGGVLADALDRRRLMMWTQGAAAIFAGLLALATFGGYDSVPVVYLLTAATAAAMAFDNPARQSLIPNLVPREHLSNAVSLNTLMWQIATIVGPALAGVLVGWFNLSLVYLLNALSFVAVLVALWLMHYRKQERVEITGLNWQALVEGVRFTYRSRLIWSTMLLDFFATFFSSARTMLPIVASDILGVGVQGYGLLATAQPIGAVLAGSILSLRREIQRQGAVLLISVVIYGLGTAFFGVSTVFALSYLLFGLTGAADTVSTVIRGTLRQVMTPDHLRGRMIGVNMIFFMGGPQLGELEAGLVAAALGAPFAIVSGGLATVLLTGWVAWKYPRLRRYTAATAAEVTRT
ncbi:MAG: MFS transporter [Anaerolineae bacterium]|nr:MFS transporter [Anaerolineales bacterium]MCQ3975010.1 MFS transporter [Anaerolineae bacterium]